MTAPTTPNRCRLGDSPPEISHLLAQAGFDPAQWPTVWYKGGSEPGVLTLGFLATNSKDQTFVVAAMLSDPAAALSPSATPELPAIVRGAFELAR
jgi:hypothetical protein